MTPKAPENFVTERLTAERLHPFHLDELVVMNSDAEVMETLGGVRSREQTASYLEVNLKHWAQYGFGMWILRDRRLKALVGRGGLRHLQVEGMARIEIAYALCRQSWGLGLATEIAKKLVSIGFECLHFEELVAVTLPENTGSRRVMEKAGFKLEREIAHGKRPHVLYRAKAPC